MRRRYAKHVNINDFELLNILPEPDMEGVRSKDIGRFFRGKGIKITDSGVYSRLKRLAEAEEKFVDLYIGERKSSIYDRRAPVLWRLTPDGVLERDKGREEYRKKFGEEPPAEMVTLTNDERPSAPQNSPMISDFLSKYRV